MRAIARVGPALSPSVARATVASPRSPSSPPSWEAASPLCSRNRPTDRANALAAGQTVDLRVLLIGAPGGATDPTTSAWAAGLTTQGVAYKEIDGTGALGSATISLPLASLESSATHGLYNAVVFAGKPGDFAAGQFTNLFAYESTFGIRQLDGNFVPPSGGTLGLIAPTVADPSTGAGISTTTPIPTLTAAGLTDVPGVGRSGADRHRHVRRPGCR